MLNSKIQFTLRHIAFITAISGMSLLLVACWDRVETNDLAIITGAAIDYTDEGETELSFQIFIPSASGAGTETGGASASGGQETLVMSHKGKNMSDALSKIQADLSRKLFWGMCKIVIFGEKAAEAGLHDHLDLLLRHPEPRERALAFVSQGEAKSFLELNAELERYSAEYIWEMAKRGNGLEISLLDLDEMLNSEDEAVMLPYLKQFQTSSKKVATMTGTAIFERDRMIGLVSELSTRGLLWLRNELKDFTINFEVEEHGEVAIYPAKNRTCLIPKIEGDEWKMIIKVKAEGSIIQNATNLNINMPTSLEKIEQAFREKIESRLKSTIDEVMSMQADVVGFGQRFHHKYPKEWDQVKHQWREKFPEVKLEFIVDANIRRKGYISAPVTES